MDSFYSQEEALLKRINNLIQQYPQNQSLIKDTLEQLEKRVKYIEDDDINLFGYIKYIVAQTYLDHIDLNQSQRYRYTCQLSQFQEDFQKMSYLNLHKPNNANFISIDNCFKSINKRANDNSMNNKFQRFQTNQFLFEFKQNKIFLIFGCSGTGKSSFIQKITGDKRAQIGHNQNSHTIQCQYFCNGVNKFIDTPGICDTNPNVNDFDILLIIAKFLHGQQIKPQDIFTIYISNSDLEIQQKHISMLSFTYFLYEIYGGKISSREAEKFFGDYTQSFHLLNWSDSGFHHKKNNDDYLFDKRALIFSNRDKASNYFQIFNVYHIVVKTFFDKKIDKNLQYFDQYKLQFLKEQIWSNNYENSNLFAYKEYIQNQEAHLMNKIESIIDTEDKNQSWNEDSSVQNILLIGPSQVGKSSLIEQLTKIKGLRGSGGQSKTSNCFMYPFTFEQNRYRLIDTPGYFGSEQGQDSFGNLKVIADYLRRNKINEFKILLLSDNINIRDNTEQVLNELFIFIQQMFDQDTSFINTDYLEDILIAQCKQLDFKNPLYGRVLFVQREYPDNYQNCRQNRDQNIIKFQSNFFTDNGNFIEVDIQVDRDQQQHLFTSTQRIEALSIEDKILFRMQLTSKYTVVISTQDEYEKAYLEIDQKYRNLYEIQNQISYQDENINRKQQLIYQKSKMIQDLFQQQFALLEGIKQIVSSKQYNNLTKSFQNNRIYSNNNNSQQISLEKLKNDINRHFFQIEFSPILHETESNSQNILISRKQHYFSLYYHQFKYFIQDNNPNHIKLLEDLARLKVIQEITLRSYLQIKYIEQNYDKNSEEVLEWIGVFARGLNTIFGTGAQIYRYATYFSMIGETTIQAQKLARNLNVAALWVNAVLASISIGIDIYQNSKGYISSDQFKINTAFNLSSALISFGAFLIPGAGWIVGGVAGGIALTGHVFSSLLFTSKQIFDETIGLVFKKMIDDPLPNQQLLYFQKSNLLREEFQFTNYTQLNQKEGYEMFRKLEVKNYEDKKCWQKSMLLRLFKNSKKDNIIDIASHHMIENILSNQFCLEFASQQEDQDIHQYLLNTQKQLEGNKQIIDTFYYSSDIKMVSEVNSSLKQAENLIKQKQKELEMKKPNVILSYQEKLVIKECETKLNTFVDYIKNNKITYLNQKEFGGGPFRKNNRYPILIKGYCNLIELKTKCLYQQKIISELKRDNQSYCFQLKDPNINCRSFLRLNDCDDLINLLGVSDNYIQNRFLQKIVGQQEPNLTYISENEVLDCKLDYSINLHQVAKRTNSYEEFIREIIITHKNFSENQIGQKLSFEILLRLKSFYSSYNYLKEEFK